MLDIKVMRTKELAFSLVTRAFDDGRTFALVCTSDAASAERVRLLAIESRCNVLVLEFDDVETDRPSAFSPWQANQAFHFLETARTLGMKVVVACDGGRSRAAAIAAACMRINGESDMRYWLQPERFSPNIRVYGLLLERANISRAAEEASWLRELKEAMLAYRIAHAGDSVRSADPGWPEVLRQETSALEDGRSSPRGEETQEGAVSIVGFSNEYQFMSNFYENAPTTVGGVEYRNSEAAYQAGRAGTLLEESAFSGLDPASARRMGHHGIRTRGDWESMKLERMKQCVRAKFFGNLGLAWKLVQTGDAELCELNTWGDEFWGMFPTPEGGRGQNHLGKILMEVRRELRESVAGDWPRRTHPMKLADAPYEKVKAGLKTVELRLYDEKRKHVRPGDAIAFSHVDGSKPPIWAIVTNVSVYPDFELLFRNVDLMRCGYAEGKVGDANPSDMDAYYSPEERQRYSACAIGFVLANDALPFLDAPPRKPGYPVEQLLFLSECDETGPGPDAFYVLAFVREDEVVLHKSFLQYGGGYGCTVSGQSYIELAGALGVSADALSASSVEIVDAIRDNYSCVDGFERFVAFCGEHDDIEVSRWRF